MCSSDLVLLVSFVWKNYRSEFSWWRHGLLPLAGAVIFTIALYKSVVPLPAAPLDVMPLAIIIWVVIGLVLMLWIRSTNPTRLDTIGKTMFIEADEEYEAGVAAKGLGEELETKSGA